MHESQLVDAVLVRNADRMMMIANLLRDGVELRFADGRKGLVPFADIPEVKERAGLWSASSCPTPMRWSSQQAQGERIEIPWDFARHYCDESYRPTVEALAMRGRKTLGERIRTFRESAGLSQEALATAADIGRVTLVRLEKGSQAPRFKTLTAIARALGRPVQALLVEPEPSLP